MRGAHGSLGDAPRMVAFLGDLVPVASGGLARANSSRIHVAAPRQIVREGRLDASATGAPKPVFAPRGRGDGGTPLRILEARRMLQAPARRNPGGAFRCNAPALGPKGDRHE